MKRDLIPTALRTEFGEVLDDAAFRRPMGANLDFTYVAGSSDLRRARDLAKGLVVAERESMSADPTEAQRGAQNAAVIQEEIRRCLAVAGLSLPAGQIRPKDIPTLPVRLHWVRTTKVQSGRPDNTKQIGAAQVGYRAVTKADLGTSWFREAPIGATEQADGSYVLGDTILMVCDAKDAARNAALNAREVELQTKRVDMETSGVELVESKVADKPVKVRSRQFQTS